MRNLIPKPKDGVKSFYGKAKVQDIHHSLYGNGEALYSYDKEIIRKYGNTLMPVAHPSHYNTDNPIIAVTTNDTTEYFPIECITVIRNMPFWKGSAIKYLWRAGIKEEEGKSNKNKEIEDL